MTRQAIVDSTFIGDGLSQNRDMQARDSLLPDREAFSNPSPTFLSVPPTSRLIYYLFQFPALRQDDESGKAGIESLNREYRISDSRFQSVYSQLGRKSSFSQWASRSNLESSYSPKAPSKKTDARANAQRMSALARRRCLLDG
ncbi:hypothetical protein NE237_016345 [Protea cynaroides]|uniref:Uncharacterized protein n=1 Tax=Protea cynaroides TaxID=273540 RepID=A0A9Q0GP30_9MAGN|nr:hypothetical protein NE237_016345 [Protea cynaroides]